MQSFDFPPKILYENKYCNQDDFNVLVCGERIENKKVVRSVFKLHFANFECKEYT